MSDSRDTLLRARREHLAAIDAFTERCAGRLDTLAAWCTEAIADGGKVLWFGNGGSAADAQHLAAEFVNRLDTERRAFAAIALTTDSSVLTSVANDVGFRYVFARQIEALARPGDVAIGITTSGASENVIEAVRTAAARGVRTAVLTGGDGGAIAQLADLAIAVPSSDTARIQETHIFAGHVLCADVERRMLARVGTVERLEAAPDERDRVANLAGAVPIRKRGVP